MFLAETIQKPKIGVFWIRVPRSLRGKSRWVSRPGPQMDGFQRKKIWVFALK